METRIKITLRCSLIGSEKIFIDYDILNGQKDSLADSVLAQSETTGGIWHITKKMYYKPKPTEGTGQTFPVVFAAPIDHHESISEGEILKIIPLTEIIGKV